MSNVPALFAGKGNLPAFLKSAEPQSNGLAVHHTEGYPVMRIKGKQWTVTQGQEKFLQMNPKDPDSPASHIEVVIVKASPIKQKVWYASQWKDGEEMGKPDCFSNDGTKPDPQSAKPQAKSCAVCKKNQWGSKVNNDGTASKGKACNDTIRLAIAPASDLDNTMMLRLPPASIKPAGDYGSMLAKRGVPLEAVITKLRFDPDAPTPKVLFEPVGFLDEAAFNHAQEVAASERVEAILGAGVADTEEETTDVLAEVPSHVKAAKPATAVAPTHAVEEDDDDEKAIRELQARVAARKAAVISADAAVSSAEVKAAIDAAEIDKPVLNARQVGSFKQDATNSAIEVGDIPSLAEISFDD